MSKCINQAQIDMGKAREALLYSELKKREMTPIEVQLFLKLSKSGSAKYTKILRNAGLINSRETSPKRIIFFAISDKDILSKFESMEEFDLGRITARAAALRSADAAAKIKRNWFGGVA